MFMNVAKLEVAAKHRTAGSNIAVSANIQALPRLLAAKFWNGRAICNIKMSIVALNIRCHEILDDDVVNFVGPVMLKRFNFMGVKCHFYEIYSDLLQCRLE